MDTGACRAWARVVQVQAYNEKRAASADRRCKMGKCPGKLNMYDPAVFAIRVQGEIGEEWVGYFGARTISMERAEAGFPVTVLTTEPVDQAGLIGVINHVNMLGLPLVSVECLSAPEENRPAMKGDH